MTFLRGFPAALGFLTVIPIPRSVHEDGAALKRAVWWFPAVGLLAGGLLAGLDHVLVLLFPPVMRAVLLVVSWLVLTRGLHMDGLADAADGLLSFRSREKMLEIMRDPRSGPMGVMAVTSALALKMAAAYSLPEGIRWKSFLLAPMTGRCAMGLVMGLFPYARPEGGFATPLQSGHGRWKAVWCAAACLALSGFVLGGRGFAAAMPALVGVCFVALRAARRLGGYTGDILGAVCEVGEILWLAGLLVGQT